MHDCMDQPLLAVTSNHKQSSLSTININHHEPSLTIVNCHFWQFLPTAGDRKLSTTGGRELPKLQRANSYLLDKPSLIVSKLADCQSSNMFQHVSTIPMRILMGQKSQPEPDWPTMNICFVQYRSVKAHFSTVPANEITRGQPWLAG